MVLTHLGYYTLLPQPLEKPSKNTTLRSNSAEVGLATEATQNQKQSTKH